MIAQTYAATYNLPVAITRCGKFYGGGDLNWNRVVPGTVRSILRGERPVIRSDGQFVRDYFYIQDAPWPHAARRAPRLKSRPARPCFQILQRKPDQCARTGQFDFVENGLVAST